MRLLFLLTLPSQPLGYCPDCVFPKLKKLGMWTKRADQYSVDVGLHLDGMEPWKERCRSTVVVSFMEVCGVFGNLTVRCQK